MQGGVILPYQKQNKGPPTILFLYARSPTFGRSDTWMIPFDFPISKIKTKKEFNSFRIYSISLLISRERKKDFRINTPYL